MINYTASILNGFKHFCCNFVHSYYSIEGLDQFGQKSWKVVTYALKLIVLPFGMFLIFALLNTWKSQYYTWPLFASSFCGKHGVAQGGFVCFSFVSSSFFFVEVLAAIIYEQGGHKREKMWLWRWASDKKKGTGRRHFYSSHPSQRANTFTNQVT